MCKMSVVLVVYTIPHKHVYLLCPPWWDGIFVYGAPEHRCTGAPEHRCSGAPGSTTPSQQYVYRAELRCTGAPEHQSPAPLPAICVQSGAPEHRCAGVPVHRSTRVQHPSQHPLVAPPRELWNNDDVNPGRHVGLTALKLSDLDSWGKITPERCQIRGISDNMKDL